MEKINVLVDCDPGIDDFIALVEALAEEHMEILGITTVAGNLPIEFVTNNALYCLKLLGREEIPVAEGEGKPLERELEDASFIHGDSGMGNYRFPMMDRAKLYPKSAPEFLYEKIISTNGKVVLLALAPLTNIARLLQLYPEVIEYIDRIIFMGGAIRSGNPTPVATFNVLADPEAARYVFQSGVELHLLPLDTTRKVYFGEGDLEKLLLQKTPLSMMVYDLLQFIRETDKKYVQGEERFSGAIAHDLPVVTYLAHPEYFKSFRCYADVETDGELTTGFTLIDYENILQKTEEEKNIWYVHSVNRDKVLEELYKSLKIYEEKRGKSL